MRSKWIEHKGKKILYQDFSGLLQNYDEVKAEFLEVREVVKGQPFDSVLILSNFTGTTIAGDLMETLNESSRLTKDHIKKTAVIGVTSFKHRLADILIRLTGRPLKYFNSEKAAKDWLVKD